MSKRVLILNWRDPWHPKSGGAEVFTFRIAQRLAARGWFVEWFSADYAGAVAEEVRDGVRFVRAGSAASVHAKAFIRYRSDRSFDVIVDEINTIPFYTSLYAAPSIALIFQLAREVWLHEAPPFLGWIGYCAEALYLRPYRNSTIATISQSSVESFRAFGLRGPAHVVPIAVDEAAVSHVPAKAAGRDALVVSRLVPSKRIEDAIEAAGLLAARGWEGRLHIVGRGEPRYVERLRERASAVASPDRVVFHGRVPDDLRSRLLSESSVLWMTSVREGWGLVVTEAARHATPSVVYNVAGLRDAVVDGETGYVVEPRAAALAEATLRLFETDYDGFARRALERSKSYSWDRSTDDFERLLIDTIRVRQSRT